MKRLLLAVCGLHPQVITETLYALHQEGRMVDGLRLITTRKGKEACLAHLLEPGNGRFFSFLSEYGISLASVDFAPRHILVVTDDRGRELDDISSEEDNEAFLRVCMEEAFECTRDEEQTVFFSIAGGRKTMGACLALAAQIYARPQDRIFHVLVSPEFESSWDFFFPPAKSTRARLLDDKGQPFFKETKYARVTLAPMPFFPLRGRLTDRMLKRPEAPGALMLSVVKEKRAELIVDLILRTLTWKGFQLDLSPAHMALYAFFVLSKKQCIEGRETCRSCHECSIDYQSLNARQQEIARLHAMASAGGPAFVSSSSGIVSLSKENFNSYRAKINREIERRFGGVERERLGIMAVGKRPSTKYMIPLDRGRIRIIQ